VEIVEKRAVVRDGEKRPRALAPRATRALGGFSRGFGFGFGFGFAGGIGFACSFASGFCDVHCEAGKIAAP